jgi:hypothetical protein
MKSVLEILADALSKRNIQALLIGGHARSMGRRISMPSWRPRSDENLALAKIQYSGIAP